MSFEPKIAIIGAGPGGLTLANILRNNSIPFKIFDLASTLTDQGGTLDLHPADGQRALREAGLWDAFVKHSRPEADVRKIVRSNGEVLWDGNTNDKRDVKEEEKFEGRPEIDRGVLNAILLEGLGGINADCIAWGKKLAEVVPSTGQKHNLRFSDDSVETDFDLVIGADGAWSKVRALLTDQKPYYSGISSVEMWALDVDKTNPWMSEYVGAGSLFSFGEGRAIQIQRLGDGTVRTYGSLAKPETFLQDCGIDWTKPDSARKDYVAKYFDDCGEELKRMLLESKDKLVPRALYTLPVGHAWPARPGVTLVGDAAHLMTPFAGVGVNAAMVDSLSLGQALVEYKNGIGKKSLAMVVKEYEMALFPRGAKYAQKTVDNQKTHFSAGGSEHLAGRLRAVYG